jgi:hypothetical protein
MPYLSPPTLTRSEQQSLLEVSAAQPRDHLVFSLALGTGLIWSDRRQATLVFRGSPGSGTGRFDDDSL